MIPLGTPRKKNRHCFQLHVGGALIARVRSKNSSGSKKKKIQWVMSTDQVFVHFSLPLHMLPHHKKKKQG
jgi:hypothetical protein